jgi:nitrate reductase gamma subunit
MTGMCLLLAETPTDIAFTRFLWPGVGTLLGLIVLIGAFSLIRRRIRRQPASSSPPGGFTLGELRALVKDGKMTAEEFERAKNKILDAHKKATAVKPAQETTSPKQFPPQV